MAEVYRCHDQQLNRKVAIKVFREAQARRIEVEIRALANARHENLITLYDVMYTGEPATDGRPYLVMEYVRGAALADWIGGDGVVPANLTPVATGIADALHHVHEQRIVHRDVSPSNILIGDDGRARLSDFGVALLPGDDAPIAFNGGTAAYLSPEQAAGRSVGPASDVYSFALVLIEALTGRRCFSGPSEEAALARLTRVPEVPSHLPRPWAPLLSAMTATDPCHRPTAREVSVALREGFYEAPVPIRLLERRGA